LSLLEDASVSAAADDMETVDRILSDVMDTVRHAAPHLPPSAWDEVRRRQESLQQEIDAAGARIRAQLDDAGGGRRAAQRYRGMTPQVDE
jgi:hypothetical protein